MPINELQSPTVNSEAKLARIVAHHSKFLSFLASRVEDGTVAEDLLQAAYIKAIQHSFEIRQDESTVAWFYRVLRNAIADHYRMASAQTRAHETYSAELSVSYEPQTARTVCACIEEVIRDLKTEYREAIQLVDLGGATVESFAQSQQMTANNASVRLYRARKAVAKKLTAVCGTCAEHKCLDCTCRRSQL